MEQQRAKKYTGLVYGEGRKDKNFLIMLTDLEKFKYHTKKWAPFRYRNGSGGSPESILEQCRKLIRGYSYDLVICFIDLDTLKRDFPNNKWKSEEIKLEKYYGKYGIEIIWQLDKLEDEFVRVLGYKSAGKKEINKLARKNIEKFINSEFWKRILKVIKDRERDLQEIDGSQY